MMDLSAHTKHLEDELRDQLRTSVGKPCIICKASSVAAHIWILNPRLAAEHFADGKKLRIYAYAVCGEHDPAKMVLPESKENIQRQVHDRIVDRLKKQASAV